MYRNIGLLFATAALAAISTAADARDGCGPGRYYNGYRCVSERIYDRRFDERGPPALFDFGGGYDQRYSPPSRRWNTFNGCPPRYTVQDGLCKPYSGR